MKKANKKLWIVGKCRRYDERTETFNWDFQGVFDTKEKAIAACKSIADFVAPAVLNKELPEKSEEWKGCFYPRDRRVKCKAKTKTSK